MEYVGDILTISRVILAFERLTPLQVCDLFSRGVGRPARYIHAHIRVEVSVPSGYSEHLQVLQSTLGDKRAPYFGPTYEYPNEALSLWEGYRGIEEYAREVFPLEEAANGLTWMDDNMLDGHIDSERHVQKNGSTQLSLRIAADGTGHAQLVTQDMGNSPKTPIGVRMPRAHPEGEARDFFVGSC